MKLGRNIIGLLLTIQALVEVGAHLSGVSGNALVKFTAIVDGLSGKIAGTVFARNKGGAYARGKGNPTNPQTAAQSAVRSRFAQIAQAWRGLTNDQRKAWDASTDDYPYNNRMGDSKHLSGSGLHQKLNLNRASVELANIALPSLPKALELPLSFSVAADATAGTARIAANFAGAPTGSTMFAVYATEPSSAGRKNLKTRLRKIAVQDSDDLDGVDLLPAYTAKFGALVIGANVAFELRPVQSETGQGSAPFYTVSTAV